jgi:hypothetical protein
MRIVDVAAFYTPFGGGVKTYIDRKMVAGPQLGHEVICVAPGRSNHVEELGMREPTPLSDELTLHHGDVRGGAPKGGSSEPQEYPRDLDH